MLDKARIQENPDGSFTIDPQSYSNRVYTTSKAQKDLYIAYSKVVVALVGAFGIGMALAVFFTDFGGLAVISYVLLILILPFLNDVLLRRIFRGAIVTRQSAGQPKILQALASDGMRALLPRWLTWSLFVLCAALFVVTALAPINAAVQGEFPEPTLLIFPAAFLFGAIQTFATLRSDENSRGSNGKAR